MPNSESKTTEDILREMREYADQLDNDGDITGADFRDFANQIEQAIARDTLCLSDGSLVIVRSAEIRARLVQLDAEYVGYKNAVAIIAVLNKVHDYLGKLVRDNLVKDTPEASDLADDVWDAIHACPKGSAADLNNVAAMREALIQCELFLGNVSRHGHPTLNPGDKCTACDGVDELRGMVVAALAGPARNCDIYDAENGAAECMQAIDAAWHEIDTIRATIGWMLAPVNTKGADDGI